MQHDDDFSSQDGKSDGSSETGASLSGWVARQIAARFTDMKQDRWEKYITSEGFAEAVEMFAGDEVLSGFAWATAGSAQFSVQAPKSRIAAGIMFMKLMQTSLTVETIEELVLVLDYSEPLSHLRTTLEHVFLPLVTARQNQFGWSEAVRKDVNEELSSYLAALQIAEGRTVGDTKLPLPPRFDKLLADDSSPHKEAVHVLESCIITWSKQIKHVLSQDPEQLLVQDAHPGPLTEVEFWENKAQNLNSIFKQLQSERLRKVLQFLETSRSTYIAPFVKLCTNVFHARLEANDNVGWLKWLKLLLKPMEEEDDFPKLVKYFQPVMSSLLKTWKHSRFYNTTGRLVVMIRELCNCIIRHGSQYVSGQHIFELIEQDNAIKAVDMLATSLRVCGLFKTTYFDYKAKTSVELPDNQWNVRNSVLFARLERFVVRIQDIRDFTQTIVQFSRLQRIEIGGTKGNTLTTSIAQIYQDFHAAVNLFRSVKYDIINIDAKAFYDDHHEFRCTIKQLERRLASILTQGFDDSPTVSGRFKLLESFEGLLARPIINDEMQRKQLDLLAAYGQDLVDVQQTFNEEKDDPPIPHNMPPVSGAIAWCDGLLSRITNPMNKLRQLNAAILARDEALPLRKLHLDMEAEFKRYKKDRFEAWKDAAVQSSSEMLQLSVLVRELTPDGRTLLRVNFDPTLVQLLREVKYAMLLGLEDRIPDQIKLEYRKAEIFRTHTGNLELIVNMYNRIQTTMLPVEEPLMRPHIEKMDAGLMAGLKQLNWKNQRLDSFITEAMTTVKYADQLLDTMKVNLRKIQALIDEWVAEPLLIRRTKPLSLEAYQAMIYEHLNGRYQRISEGGRTASRLVKETNRKLKVAQGQADWKAYVDFVSNVVLQGLTDVVVKSLEFVNEQVDAAIIARESKSPLLETHLDLVANAVEFVPNTTSNEDETGIRDRVHSWIDSCLKIGTLFPRLDQIDGSYIRELQTDPEVRQYIAAINGNVFDMEEQCEELRQAYLAHSHLWNSDIPAVFKSFLAKALRPVSDAAEADGEGTPEEGTSASSSAGDAEERTEPPPAVTVNASDDAETLGKKGLGLLNRKLELQLFDQKLKEYRELQVKVVDMRASTDVTFVRVNSQPVKQALGTWVNKWIYLYTQYLSDFVTDHLQWLQWFTAAVHKGLTDDADAVKGEEGRAELLRIMTQLRDVRRVTQPTIMMFQPLKDTVELLRAHGYPLSSHLIKGQQSSLDYLEEAEVAWKETVDYTFRVKDSIRGAQLTMADNVRAEISAFGNRVQAFRKDFLQNGPFSTNSTQSADDTYPAIQNYQTRLRDLQAQQARFEELEDLFELAPSSFEAIGETWTDLRLLKAAWDMYALVDYSIEDWKTTPWADVDGEELLDRTKLLQTQVKRMPARMRPWDIYAALVSRIRTMATVLPLIQDLKSPAMRDRHWTDLIAVTGVMIDKGPNFRLEDVLSMNLHQHVQGVQEIVEIARREVKIETKLNTIEDTWTTATLNFVPYKDMDVRILRPPDSVVEDLEEHMLNLQGMAGMGKFVEYFRDRVNHWQLKLTRTESVLRRWLAVQRVWEALEPIFMGSSDIRNALPEDSKRFETADNEFKELMRGAEGDRIVVDACTRDGREEMLAAMFKQLEICQKALNEYLDMKKNVFPRFFFLANTALLDMLANANDPPRIMPYIGDCFDAIKTLRLDSSLEARELAQNMSEETGTKVQPQLDSATDILAKDGEVLELDRPFRMSGPVEEWLQVFEQLVQDTIRTKLDDALDKTAGWVGSNPRENWLYPYPAQVVLLAAQITWTEESERALEDVETGNEDALRKYLDVCNVRLQKLIQQVLGNLNNDDRSKIISLITIDVHARDVIQNMMMAKVGSPTEFLWQSQLRFYYKEQEKDVDIKINDFRGWYVFEYIGNCGRLVITPLTDRCYITLTMAMRLMLGGAPAGPAGTGKTETTKDLARAMGLPCYVFNCSDQMNYQTMADIFKGLAQTGAWGCFDEFNRISIEVLSVVATQVASVLDAVRHLSFKGNREAQYRSAPEGRPPMVVGSFMFGADKLRLIPTVGMFITMNPGYAGRTELPENLKALFRSCAMIRPDLALICENMLMSEGFVKARPLSVKFVTLYKLSSELLSQQVHYDWGLRAVKAVLRVAGNLKRSEPKVPEEAILMRALRDFNTPKIPAADLPVFLRLIADLFIGLELERVVNEPLRAKVAAAARKTGLQPEEGFLLKVEQFDELLHVRHSVMILGPAGSGKTKVWQTLQAAYNLGIAKPICVTAEVNPKAVTVDELYGYMTLAKEWKDGVLSIIMRSMAKCVHPYTEHQVKKWVVLDGDIDAEWIESMNTVMDDNKVLTLVSNERIPLSPAMRMVFEINSLANATPATVSRAGILYINDHDIGWRPFVDSWIASAVPVKLRGTLSTMFTRYIDTVATILEVNKLAPVVPTATATKVRHLCAMLEAILEKPRCFEALTQAAGAGGGNRSRTSTMDGGAAARGVSSESGTTEHSNDASSIFTTESIEAVFVFCLVWSFGGSLTSDGLVDPYKQFDRLFTQEFKFVKYPTDSSVYDVFFKPIQPSEDSGARKTPKHGSGSDKRTYEVVAWADVIPSHMHSETAFGTMIIPTAQSMRVTQWLQLLTDQQVPVMLIGPTGTGKTTLVQTHLASLDERYQKMSINFNYYTSADSLQRNIEQRVEKRSGRIFGPSGNKRLMVFIDDFNMAEVETYGTQTPIALLRQFLDYGGWYDKTDLAIRKQIKDTQLVASMNPKAGSFTINERLQRHFVTCSVEMPSHDELRSIYTQVMEVHFSTGFRTSVTELVDDIVTATVDLRARMASQFLPSAVNFHYNFTMRELSAIFSGLCLSSAQNYVEPMSMVRLWLHECTRVFADRLSTESDLIRFQNMLVEHSKKYFEMDAEEMHAAPLIFTSFATPHTEDEAVYLPVPDSAGLRKVLQQKLDEYNETESIMELVLFEQAAEHVCRIARILSTPCGSALLVGVGGSGKQSLTRLAAFIAGCTLVQPTVTTAFKVPELLELLRELYRKAGVKPALPMVLMLTDAQIIDERFLVYINDLLATGVVSDLFTQEDMEGIFGQLRMAAKAAGVPDSRDSLSSFFIDRVRSNLHVALCMSPVDEAFRRRAKRFPAIVNCSSMMWFHPWPKEALVSVADTFLADVPAAEDPALRENLAHHMAELHLSVAAAAQKYLRRFRRHVYNTPKSFLELILFFRHFLQEKTEENHSKADRLTNGIGTLRRTKEDVAKLQMELQATLVRVEEKKEATDALLSQMTVEQEEVEKQQGFAAVEQAKADEAAAEAAEIEASASVELDKAKPALIEAQNAVDCLDKNSLIELRSMTKPPPGVDKVTTAVLMLLNNEKRNFSWDNAKKMMGKIDHFKSRLETFDGRTIAPDKVARVDPVIEDDVFDPVVMRSKSVAAANLSSWVINIMKYHKTYVKVAPLMERLEKAQAMKAVADSKLAQVQARVDAVNAHLQELQDRFTKATEERNKVEAEAAACNARLSLAERLVGGLASENSRWSKDVERLRDAEASLVGDVMLASAFLSYALPFDAEFREELWHGEWLPDLMQREIPTSDGVDPLNMLATDAEIASFETEGLPADRTSRENGAVIVNSQRYPLLVDPQLQGLKWIMKHEQSDPDRLVHVARTTQSDWKVKLEAAIATGGTFIVENLTDSMEVMLQPIISKAFFRSGRALYVRLGAKTVEFDPRFRLYMQTRLSNPHFKPEIQAQTTMVNFIVTKQGLEEQLLAHVVNREQPDLEADMKQLQDDFAKYKIELKQLEDNLLERLANAPEDILSDEPLIESLEATKKTVTEIEEAVERGKETEAEIQEARNAYRIVATEGASLYFLTTSLWQVDHMYQYSLASFVKFFFKAMERCPPSKKPELRGEELRESVRQVIFRWVARGLFEQHKLIFLTLLTMELLRSGIIGSGCGYSERAAKFLMRPSLAGAQDNVSPFAWLPSPTWNAVEALSELPEFAEFASDLQENGNRFEEWFNHITPELEKLPLKWRELSKTPFLRLLVIRALRPDRLSVALTKFIEETLPNGAVYTQVDSGLNSFEILQDAYTDSVPASPLYFILSPGTDVSGDLDKLVKQEGLVRGESFFDISLGQGQDVIAEARLRDAHQAGHWVLLNNAHLMPRWLQQLEKMLDEFESQGSHEKFRIFLSSDPSRSIAVGLLNRCIKLTNEPPSGLKANLQRALRSFNPAEMEEVDGRTRAVLFGLCHFHAVMMERIKFGPIGFNMRYPFATGDLQASATVLKNYMESASQLPWQDLRYLFGEIMYGGHIVNDWDRLLANTYLEYFMRDQLLDEMELLPFLPQDAKLSFKAPQMAPFRQYIEHVDHSRALASDSPLAFGLHPNAEMRFRTEAGRQLLETIQLLQPSDATITEGADGIIHIVGSFCQDLLDDYADSMFDIEEMRRSLDAPGPFQTVFLQECESMNKLTAEIVRTVEELELGIKGELTMTDAMEVLMDDLYRDRVPAAWAKLAYPSQRALGGWRDDLAHRIVQLADWAEDVSAMPLMTWLGGLFMPQSFLTAVMQSTAQRTRQDLDKLVSLTEITKKTSEDVQEPARDGAYVTGLQLEGARWDINNQFLVDSRPKQAYCPLPVVHVKAVQAGKEVSPQLSQVPVYRTQQRGPTFVFTAQLRTKEPQAKWILAGVALLMEVVI